MLDQISSRGPESVGRRRHLHEVREAHKALQLASLHRLASAFILGYHGCDRRAGERLLAGTAFKPSNNDYDWLGPGIYFWEANPLRGLEFAEEASRRRTSNISMPLTHAAALDLPSNSRDELRRNLDCAVVRRFRSWFGTLATSRASFAFLKTSSTHSLAPNPVHGASF